VAFDDYDSFSEAEFDAEERRIASAGYPEQHRLFLENKLQRARLRQWPRLSRERTFARETARFDAHDAALAERERLEAWVQSRVGMEFPLYLSKVDAWGPGLASIDRGALRRAFVAMYRAKAGLPIDDPDLEAEVPHVDCRICERPVPRVLVLCWHCFGRVHESPAR